MPQVRLAQGELHVAAKLFRDCEAIYLSKYGAEHSETLGSKAKVRLPRAASLHGPLLARKISECSGDDTKGVLCQQGRQSSTDVSPSASAVMLLCFASHLHGFSQPQQAEACEREAAGVPPGGDLEANVVRQDL